MMRIAAVAALMSRSELFRSYEDVRPQGFQQFAGACSSNGERISMTHRRHDRMAQFGHDAGVSGGLCARRAPVKVTGGDVRRQERPRIQRRRDVRRGRGLGTKFNVEANEEEEFSPPTCSAAAGFRSATGRTAATGSRWSRTRRSIWKTESCSFTRRRTPTNCSGRTASSA